MRVTDNERKQYIKEIKALLVCDKDQQEKFLKNFNSDIDDYLSDNPEAGLDELKRDFGTPQEIADGFLSNASPKDIKKQMSWVKVLIIIGIIALVIFGGCLFALWLDTHEEHDTYGEITFTQYDENNGTTNIVKEKTVIVE